MAKSTDKNNTLLWLCRIAVGVLFIFSGLIKANDPLGFSYKLDEYFEVFHLLSLSTFSLLISVLLCALEVILGFALLIGWRAKTVTWGLLLLIIFFGFLTFYSAWFKVVQSCGCFGDAIPLTPWQSFAKDMALLLLVLVPFAQRRNIRPLFTPKTMRNLFVASVIVAFGVGIYTYNFLPVIDFLPYKVGNNLPEQMATPPGAKPDEYELTYHMVNKKSGEKKDITDKEYLKTGIWKDASWEIKGDPESKLVKKGFTPKIRDLVIQDAQGNDYTQELLANPFKSLWIVAYNLNQTDEDAIDKLNAIAINLIQNYNTRVVLLTSTSHETAEKFSKAHHLSAEIFYADGVPLKTMVRSNPGIMLMKKGTVLGKWHYHTVPSYDNLVKDFFQK